MKEGGYHWTREPLACGETAVQALHGWANGGFSSDGRLLLGSAPKFLEHEPGRHCEVAAPDGDGKVEGQQSVTGEGVRR
jgi:hypothetical protein